MRSVYFNQRIDKVYAQKVIFIALHSNANIHAIADQVSGVRQEAIATQIA